MRRQEIGPHPSVELVQGQDRNSSCRKRSALLWTRWGETTAPPWSSPAPSWRWRVIRKANSCFSATTRRSQPLVAGTRRCNAASRRRARRIRRADGGQAEPGAALRPAQVLDVARHRRGEEEGSRCRRIRRQYRRPDGDVEIRSQNAGRESTGRRSRRCGRPCAANSSCSTSAPRSARTPSISSILPSWARPRRASCWASSARRSGLLNIGVEEVKGLEPVREAGRILREKQMPELDYVRLRRRRRHRPGQGRRRGDRRLRRQHRAQDRRRHGPPDRRISAGKR